VSRYLWILPCAADAVVRAFASPGFFFGDHVFLFHNLNLFTLQFISQEKSNHRRLSTIDICGLLKKALRFCASPADDASQISATKRKFDVTDDCLIQIHP